MASDSGKPSGLDVILVYSSPSGAYSNIIYSLDNVSTTSYNLMMLGWCIFSMLVISRDRRRRVFASNRVLSSIFTATFSETTVFVAISLLLPHYAADRVLISCHYGTRVHGGVVYVVSALASINVLVNLHWARLVHGWVNVCVRVNHLDMYQVP